MPQFTSMKVASVMNLIFKNKIVVLFNRRWDDWSLRNSLKKALKLHLISTSAKVNFRIGKNKIDSQFYRFFLSRRPELSGYSRVVKYINPHIIYIYISTTYGWNVQIIIIFFVFLSLFLFSFSLLPRVMFFIILAILLLPLACVMLPSPPVQPLRVLLSCVFVPPFFNFHFLIYAFQFRTLTAILHFHSLVRLSPVLVEEVHFTLVDNGAATLEKPMSVVKNS